MCLGVKRFKRIFFDLPSREFGETFVEPILRMVLGDEVNLNGNEFDAVRSGANVEYKAVRVVFAPNGKKETLYDSVMSHDYMSNRIGRIKDIEEGNITANCQNIKLDEFDILVYVLVDAEGFHIFEITSKKFKEYADNHTFPNWSPNHGRKEKGKNGQFPIKSTNIQWHKDNCFVKKIPWSEILHIAKIIRL